MRADELVVLTKAEYDELKAQAEGGAGDTGELFNAEEMQAIREQYEERILVEQERREELEWKLRMELAKIRDAELSARRAADEMRRIELTLQGLLTDEDVTQVRSTVPSPSLQAVAPKPQAVMSLRKPVPPPIPAAEQGHDGNGHANGNGAVARRQVPRRDGASQVVRRVVRSPRMPTAFVAGATGYTGRALMELFATRRRPTGSRGRTRARRASCADAVVCDPRDVAKLTEGMRGCDAVVQLIGTVKARFADGDYDAIDYGTTVALGEAAKAAGVPRLLLLSSVGAGSPRGAYLAVKRKTEEWVEKSGLEYTIVRPSMIVGEGRRAAQVLGVLTVSDPVAARHRGARAGARVPARARAARRGAEQILEGKSLWKLAEGS